MLGRPRIILENVIVEIGENSVAVGDMYLFEREMVYVSLIECTLMGKAKSAGLLSALVGGAIVGGLVIGAFADQNRDRIKDAIKKAFLKRRRYYAWPIEDRVGDAFFSERIDVEQIDKVDAGQSGIVVNLRSEESKAFLSWEPFDSDIRDQIVKYPSGKSQNEAAVDSHGFDTKFGSPFELADQLVSTQELDSNDIALASQDNRYIFSLLGILMPHLHDGNQVLFDNIQSDDDFRVAILAAVEEEERHDERGMGWFIFVLLGLLVGLPLAVFEFFAGA